MKKFNEIMMSTTLLAVFVVGLAALAYIPIKLFISGNIPAAIGVGFVSVLVYGIVACFALSKQ